jgi:hypothetical protein
MHRLFGIKHESLRLRNRTHIRYLRQKVPACHTCNNVRFANIEERISTDRGTVSDLYVWASKIHWGLNLKDSFLPEVRKDPSLGTILTREEAVRGLQFLPDVFRGCGDNGFTMYPNPLGTVIKVPLPRHVDDGFALCSIGSPYNVITVSITPRNLLTVIVNDKGLTGLAIEQGLVSRHDAVDHTALVAAESGTRMNANSFAKLLTLHYCRMKCRLSIPGGYHRTRNRVEALLLPRKIRVSLVNDPAVMAHVLQMLLEVTP